MFPFPWLSSRRDSLISVLLKLAFTWITPFVILRALFRKLKRAFLRKLIGTFLREPIFGIALLIFDGHLYLWKEIEPSRASLLTCDLDLHPDKVHPVKWSYVKLITTDNKQGRVLKSTTRSFTSAYGGDFTYFGISICHHTF